MKNRTSLASFTMLSFVLMCAALVTLTVSCAAKPKIKPEAGVSAASLTAAEARELAREAWLFGLPLVMFEKLSWPIGLMLGAQLRGTRLLCRLSQELGKAVRDHLSAPLEIVRTSLPLLLLKMSNRTGVAVRGAAGDEMTPRAGMLGLLNRRSLDCEPLFEGPSFEGVP